jgi:hypothetical protein
MNLVDSVKLLPGDRVEYAGDRQMTDEWIMEFRGTVVRVAPRGGILIHDDRASTRASLTPCPPRRAHQARRPSRAKPQRNERGVRDILKRVAVERGRRAALRVVAGHGRVSNVRDLLPRRILTRSIRHASVSWPRDPSVRGEPAP